MRFSQADSTSSHAETPWCCKPEKKSHDIVILSFCIVKGQAIYEISNEVGTSKISIAFLIYIINFKVPYNKLKLKFLVQSATFLIFMEVYIFSF